MKYIFLLFILLSGFTVTKCYKDFDENCRNDIYPCLNNLEEFNVTESESYCEEFYYTQKCLDLFSFGIETIDSCNNPEIDIDTANQWIFAKSVLFRFICSVDEQGKRCPIIKLWDDIYGEKGKKLPELKVHSLIYDTIVKTCTESEKCSNEFIGFTKSISQIMAKFNIKKRNTDININIPNFKDIDLNMMYMVTNLLQSNECKNKTLQIQNGTISIKFNSKLYIVLLILVFLLL